MDPSTQGNDLDATPTDKGRGFTGFIFGNDSCGGVPPTSSIPWVMLTILMAAYIAGIIATFRTGATKAKCARSPKSEFYTGFGVAGICLAVLNLIIFYSHIKTCQVWKGIGIVFVLTAAWCAISAYFAPICFTIE